MERHHAMGLTRRVFLHGSAFGFGALGMGILARGAHAAAPFTVLQGQPDLTWLDATDAEPNLARLVQSWLTPVKHFYVRSHGKTPQLDLGAYRLKVTGLVDRELILSMEDLARYAPANAIATMQCAGNRRAEFSATKKVGGVQWGAGAIGNAHWNGVRLGDVLKAAGVKDGAKHVQFIGHDRIDHDGKPEAFGGSVSLEKALAPESLLAYGMNGDVLTPEHGFPLRAVLPGIFGVRSVKWLDTITVSAEESPNYFQQKAYKILPPTMEEKTADWSAGKPMQEMIVNAAIATVDRDGVTSRVCGYALATGQSGDALEKVELSSDGGKSWLDAAFTGPELPHCWRLWEARVPLADGAKAITVCATTRNGAMQPERVDWNFKGYGYNAWHSVPLI